ncbi:MAG: galactose-1-epimerase, partial [Bacteroidales bacterium]|nr:galactose-1-epimerase [Bacteroidales bacterium]
LEVWSDQPGLQFYSGNFLSDIYGKSGAYYDKYSGFCLEPQKYPNSVNKSNFPNIFVTPDATYCHKMAYAFNTV